MAITTPLARLFFLFSIFVLVTLNFLHLLELTAAGHDYGNTISLNRYGNVSLNRYHYNESYLNSLASAGGRVVVVRDEIGEIWNCCLNNVIMKVMSVIKYGCEAAGQHDAVQLPSNLDVGGQFVRKDFQLFTSNDIGSLVELSKSKGCDIVTKDIAKRIFTLPNKKIRIHGQFADSGDYLNWFYSNFRFPAHIEQAANECISGVETGNYVSVHLRIEKDWCDYCKRRDMRKDSSNGSCRTPRQIAEQTTSEIPWNSTDTIVLIHGTELCDDFNMSTGEHPSEVWPQVFPNARIVSKHDGGPECRFRLEKLKYNEQALVDLYYVIGGRKFVGTLVSTFSNGATQIRVSHAKYENYAYSCPLLAPLIQRYDNGELRRCSSIYSGDAGCCRWNHEMELQERRHELKGHEMPQHLNVSFSSFVGFWHIGPPSHSRAPPQKFIEKQWNELKQLAMFQPSVIDWRVNAVTELEIPDSVWAAIGNESGGRVTYMQPHHISPTQERPFFEFPTLDMLQKFCQDDENEKKTVFYFHTKSDDKMRRKMQKDMFDKCFKCMMENPLKQMCGAGWRPSDRWCHFQGNFWFAQCKHIRKLNSPFSDAICREGWDAGYSKEGFLHGGWPHDIRPWGRFFAEYWVTNDVSSQARPKHINGYFERGETPAICNTDPVEVCEI